MIRIAVFGNSFQSDKEAHIRPIFDMLERIHAQIHIDAEYLNYLNDTFQFKLPDVQPFKGDPGNVDIALSIGGDGTFLRTAERVGLQGIPILGINTGRLGFLADVSVADVDNALTDVYKNHYRIEERTLLQLEISDAKTDYKQFALNEIAILKRDNSSMIRLEVDINERPLNVYEADGLIIATPTGSTAYSLSVGGPIVDPEADNFLISPVAPHSLTARPLIIKDDNELHIHVKSRTDAFQVAVDGTSYFLHTGQSIRIRKAPHKIRVIKRRGQTFYDTLRKKLLWGADSRS